MPEVGRDIMTDLEIIEKISLKHRDELDIKLDRIVNGETPRTLDELSGLLRNLAAYLITIADDTDNMRRENP